MHALTAAELLAVWERGQGQPPTQQACLLLTAAGQGLAPDQQLSLTIGQRDAALLTLHDEWFGSQLDGAAICPQCQEQLELNFSTADIRCAPQEQELNVALAGQTLQLRLPTSADLLAIATCADPHIAQQLLLARCVLNVEVDVSNAELLLAVSARLADADPQADVQLALTCPACGHTWLMLFDIGLFLWAKLTAWAERMFREVHVLASVYGWSEADILNLSPARRQRYLALAQGL